MFVFSFTSPEKPIWTEEFDTKDVLNGWRWTADRTSSFKCQDHNPGWNKLDYLQANDWHVNLKDNIVTFQAANSSSIILENGKVAYNTGKNFIPSLAHLNFSRQISTHYCIHVAGLLTTEYSTEQFMVKTDNYIETYVQLPDKVGAWPALWTWKPDDTKGHNEVDVFEYHVDSPNVLELTSRLYGEAACNFKRDWIKPSAWVKIGANLGKDAVTWCVIMESECYFQNNH